METGHVGGGGGAVVFLRGGSALGAGSFRHDGGEDVRYVCLLELSVDVNVVGPQYRWILQFRQDERLHRVFEEGIFVRALVAADFALEFFLLTQDPVHEGEGGVGDGEGAGAVDGGVEGELGALDGVEEHGVFEADQLVADVGEGEGRGGVGEVEG